MTRTPVAGAAGPIGRAALLSARTAPFSIFFFSLQCRYRSFHPACPGQVDAGLACLRFTNSRYVNSGQILLFTRVSDSVVSILSSSTGVDGNKVPAGAGGTRGRYFGWLNIYLQT